MSPNVVLYVTKRQYFLCIFDLRCYVEMFVFMRFTEIEMIPE